MDRTVEQSGTAKRVRKLAVCAGFALLVAVGAYVAFVAFSPSAAPWYPVVAHQVRTRVSGRATIVPKRISVIAAAGAGTIVDQRAAVGDKLKRGEVLVVMQSVSLAGDSVTAQQNLALARAQEHYANAELLDQQLERSSQMKENRQRWQVAEIKAEADEKLLATGAVSKFEVSSARSQAQLAHTLYTASVQRLKQLHVAQAAKREMLATKLRLAADTLTRLQHAQAALTIRAGHDGWLTKLDVKPGQHVAAGSPVAEVMGDGLYADIEVAQADAAAITPGTKVRLSSSVGALGATVQSVMPRAPDGSVHVKATLAGRPGWLRADMNLNADIAVGGDAPGLFVHGAASFLPNTTQRVWRRSHGKRSVSLVRFGQPSDQQIQILEGAVQGDQISALQTNP